MKRIIRTVMFIAAAAMTLPSCTKDFNEVTVDDKPAGNVSLALSASLNDVRVSREDSGKLNWEADDAIGVFIGADRNLRATTDETLCADGRFFTTGGTETTGTLYAYYPYNEYASESTGAADVWLTERGNSFGYNNLVVDFRNIPAMAAIAPRVIMDCTHSVQRPGAAGGKTGGNREFVPAMALAAKAFGATGYFFEVHPDPEKALSDGPNMLYLKDLENVIKSLI